jgi:hypothetical protein
MSAQEGEVLEALAWLLRTLHERVDALEERVPTWASGNRPLADIAMWLGRLDRAAAAMRGNVPASPADAGGRDPPGSAPISAQPMARGRALRTAIAAIVQPDPGATAPRVIEALRASYAGTPPSLRTVRWHLAALRGNGNGNGNAA